MLSLGTPCRIFLGVRQLGIQCVRCCESLVGTDLAEIRHVLIVATMHAEATLTAERNTVTP